jgi:hypothetical protein
LGKDGTEELVGRKTFASSAKNEERFVLKADELFLLGEGEIRKHGIIVHHT